MKLGHFALRALRYGWALPYSAVGLALALLALPFGATARVVEGVVEVAGGGLGRSVARLHGPLQFSAITFGHVILGVSHASLAGLRAHEQVHVRQYERWGLLFVPLYLGSSLVQLVRGRHPYAENCFEREACAGAAPSKKRTDPPIERRRQRLRPAPIKPSAPQVHGSSIQHRRSK